MIKVAVHLMILAIVAAYPGELARGGGGRGFGGSGGRNFGGERNFGSAGNRNFGGERNFGASGNRNFGGERNFSGGNRNFSSMGEHTPSMSRNTSFNNFGGAGRGASYGYRGSEFGGGNFAARPSAGDLGHFLNMPQGAAGGAGSYNIARGGSAGRMGGGAGSPGRFPSGGSGFGGPGLGRGPGAGGNTSGGIAGGNRFPAGGVAGGAGKGPAGGITGGAGKGPAGGITGGIAGGGKGPGGGIAGGTKGPGGGITGGNVAGGGKGPAGNIAGGGKGVAGSGGIAGGGKAVAGQGQAAGIRGQTAGNRAGNLTPQQQQHAQNIRNNIQGNHNNFYNHNNNWFNHNWWNNHGGAWNHGWNYWHGWGPGYWWGGLGAGALGGFMLGNYASPIYYGYGNGGYVNYQGDGVYAGGQYAGTPAQYYDQAQQLAQTPVPDNAGTEDWMPLGVFAVSSTQEDDHPSMMMQMAVNKQGNIAGMYYNSSDDAALPLQGGVDEKTQRAAWTIGDKKNTVLETGIFNLTKDETPVLVHFGDEKTQQWLMVRLNKPESGPQDVFGPPAAGAAEGPSPGPPAPSGY